MNEKKPWEMTPEEFGKCYPPMRTIGLANCPEWRYLPQLPARDTRVAAVQDAHRYFVGRALDEGVYVPDHVAALYLPADPPQDDQDALTKRLIESERALKSVVGAVLLAHHDAQALHRTVATGLVKALNEQTERAERTRADREAETKETLDRLAATMRAQAQVLAAARKTPDKPKKWHFKIQRDSHGNISGMDATSC